MTIEEATNVTIEDAIKCFEHTIFPQDFSPYTLRAKAINELVLATLRTQLQENKPLTLEELPGPAWGCSSRRVLGVGGDENTG